MDYNHLAYLHLATILPAFLIATYLLLNRKGSPLHKTLGKTYMLLMLFTAMVTLFMPAKVGGAIVGHFGFIHFFSFSVFLTVPMAYFAARTGKMTLHIGNMIGLYVGGILIAGAFAFSPGRLLHTWLFFN
ncbi:MAG: DUF2306 domain-containing protein [Bermanella sp.]